LPFSAIAPNALTSYNTSTKIDSDWSTHRYRWKHEPYWYGDCLTLAARPGSYWTRCLYVGARYWARQLL